MNIKELNSLYASIGIPVEQKKIQDPDLRSFSQNIRKLWLGLGEWLELSQGLENAIGALRRSDWRLRNDPTPRTSANIGIQQMRLGIDLLNQFQAQLPDELRHNFELAMVAAERIEKCEVTELTTSVTDIVSDFHSISNMGVSLVLPQNNIKSSVDDWIKTSNFRGVRAYTAHTLMADPKIHDKIVLVGLTKDYPDAIFTCIFPLFGIEVLSPSWIRDQEVVRGIFPDLSLISFEVPIISFEKPEPQPEQVMESFESYLEPSGEIDTKRLEACARRVVSNMGEHLAEEAVDCKAYLLANSQVVFFPLDSSEINTLDLSASSGDRVHRVAISTVRPGTIVLLRIGNSDTDSIILMADELGGSTARAAREAQRAWKTSLKEKMHELGTAKVTQDLQDLGITSPWIQEWARPSSIRPNSDVVFSSLLRYLDISIEETIAHMNHLRYLHQVAGMRFRKSLNKRFESIDATELSENGMLIVDIEDAAGVAKLGAFRVLSVGTEVFSIPQGSVRQIQNPDTLEA